jgi:hypothetical protein
MVLSQFRSRCTFLVALTTMLAAPVGAQVSPGPLASPRLNTGATGAPAPSIADAQRHFYNGQYEAASDVVLTLRKSDPDDLSGYELRSSALLFQIKRLIGKAEDVDRAYKQCSPCPDIMTAFLADISRGQAIARAQLKANPNDDHATFFLGKLDLNYVWLLLGTLGHRTGFGEYREARRSMDAVLKRNPTHVRARVAGAWIDYIVDTKVPRGFRWILGGGDKKRGLAVVRQVAQESSEEFARAEAGFGLWDMLVREKQFGEAAIVARGLSKNFPDNKELIEFMKAHP